MKGICVRIVNPVQFFNSSRHIAIAINFVAKIVPKLPTAAFML